MHMCIYFVDFNKIVFYSDCTNLHFYQQCKRVLPALYPHQRFVSATLVGVQWDHHCGFNLHFLQDWRGWSNVFSFAYWNSVVILFHEWLLKYPAHYSCLILKDYGFKSILHSEWNADQSLLKSNAASN